jgi:hypothetical protein
MHTQENEVDNYGTNRTVTGYDRSEMDEKYCHGANVSRCYQVVHQSLNCQLLQDITSLLKDSNNQA